MFFAILAAQESFPRQVLMSQLSWAILFVNCKSSTEDLQLATHYVEKLNGTARSLWDSAVVDIRFGIVDTACSGKGNVCIFEVLLLVGSLV